MFQELPKLLSAGSQGKSNDYEESTEKLILFV